MSSIIERIFLEPVTSLPLKEIALILSFAILFDFFWQFLFRYLVVIVARVNDVFKTLRYRYIQNRLTTTGRRIGSLEARLEEESEKKMLVKLIFLRSRLRKYREIEEKRKKSHPPVSIMIPCHNSEDVLEKTLKGVTSLEYDNKEIIVIDDGSTDRTSEVASKFSGAVRLTRKEHPSGRKTGAVNFGLAFASSDIVAVIDDDTIVDPNSLEPLVMSLSGQDIAATGANVKVLPGRGLLNTIQTIEYLIIMELVKPFQSFFYGAVLIISGAYGAFYKEYLQRIGAWDVDIITEDLDLTWKLYRLRKRVLYSEKAVCYTEAPSSIKALIKQRNRWDYGLFETIFKHRSFIFSRRFPALGFGLLPETVFFEIIAIGARPLFITILILTGRNLGTVTLLILYFYFVLEFILIFFVGLLSSDKKNCLKAFYSPLMLFYHQFLFFVRLRALYRFAFKRGVEW